MVFSALLQALNDERSGEERKPKKHCLVSEETAASRPLAFRILQSQETTDLAQPPLNRLAGINIARQGHGSSLCEG